MHDTTPITAKTAFSSLKAAGYPRAYVEKLLPEWWDKSLLKTSSGALQFAVILKQRLGLDVSFADDGNLEIRSAPCFARFKFRRNTQESELNLAANLGIAMAKLALFATKTSYDLLPSDPIAVRDAVVTMTGRNHVDFAGLLDLCWAHGIPVLFLKDLPKSCKRLTGMAVSVAGRPAIVLGFNHAQHSRQLFVLAHELGHVLCGHVRNDDVLIDEDLDGITETMEASKVIRKDSEEKQADDFALRLIRNGQKDLLTSIPRTRSATVLAANALAAGRDLGVDPGHLLLTYAMEHNDWMLANMALKYGRPQPPAVEVVKQRLMDNLAMDALSDENLEYLLSIQGFLE